MGSFPGVRGPRLSSRELGRAGERAAAELLRRQGYEIVGQGFLARRGEIDLLGRRGGELVVFEVKTRSSLLYGAPADAVGLRKRRALNAAVAEYRALSGWRGPIRFGIVSLLIDSAGEVRSAELLEDVL
jgi:putative endonuclease